ncbi:hypothetical protein OC846_005269 [Tilletia horrida]|uniref:Major facilitator superfamily (MFS) profile domain-containing protein n=1 Tax=Tilletia horrida TaxID=155126 RepID=A0AAN6GLL5_9BASI|nr:hypothetical protein OC845_004924 [Tilletia horrida]KAK0546425.1 hypothetical protein OC846_005269 [Tilletia horrida]KAK0562202.1 hypothetical protein OC861_005436 [Tilletia horrida]
MAITVRGSPIGPISIVIACLASMGGFLFGEDTGQISGVLLMTDFKARFATEVDVDGITPLFNSWLEGLIVSSLSIGTLIGVLVGAPLADKFGRRKAMSIECLIFTAGVLIQVTAFHAWYQVAIGRGITGIGVGALSAAVPLYQSETVPKEIRGALVATYQLFITLGILIAYLINLGTRHYGSSAQWRVPIALGILFASVLGLGIQACPESPRWLVQNGRLDQAAHSIAVVRGASGKRHEADLAGQNGDEAALKAEQAEALVKEEQQGIIRAIQVEQQRDKATWAACFKPGGKVLYRTLLGITLQAGQQLTGANYFFYYGASIFSSLGVSDPFVTQIILGAVNVFCTFIGLYLLERYGRRRPLIFGAIWMAVFLFIFAGIGSKLDTQARGTGIGLIVTACLFILGYASTWAPGIWLFVGESFPAGTRAKQAALATASNWIWNFLLAFFTTPITRNIGFNYGFVFAGCNVANALIAYFFVYETSNLTLEALNDMYNDPACKPWNSVSWVPAGFSSREGFKHALEKDEDMASMVAGTLVEAEREKVEKEKRNRAGGMQASTVDAEQGPAVGSSSSGHSGSTANQDAPEMATKEVA